MKTGPSVLLIGVGNEYRCDDGLGPLVAREIKRRSPPGVEIREESGEGASLMELWKGAHTVLIVDAVSSGQAPGTLHRFDASTSRIPSGFFHYSSHAFGLAEAIEMARELRQLPRTLYVYGLEGQSFETGFGLSEQVLIHVPELIHAIEGAIRLCMDSQTERSQFA